MDREEYRLLEVGDIVINRGSGNTYVVVEIVEGVAIVSRTLRIDHLVEWEVVKKGRWDREKLMGREGR